MKGAVPPSVTMADLYRGALPFVLIQIVALAICIAFPENRAVAAQECGLLD